MKPTLTLLVPCFNESENIDRCLDALSTWATEQDLSIELLAVDDGSTDDTRARIEAHGTARYVSVDARGHNRGKGAALRAGMSQVSAPRVVFLDADLAVGPDQLGGLLRALEAGADVAVGCRTIPGASIDGPQPMRRRWLGRMYLKFGRWFLGIGPRDVTCGFKGFEADVARDLFARTRANRWGIDAEVLYLARRLGLAVREVPVRWIDGGSSRVRLWRDVPASFASLFLTRWRHRRVRPAPTP